MTLPTDLDHTPRSTTTAPPSDIVERVRRSWQHAATTLERLVSHTFLALAARLAMAAIFFYSGRTKVTGLLSIKDATYTLFETEYRLPLIPPELAAHAATYAEHLLPLLLVFGLCSRLAAAALLGMTLVIQLFVYPDAWPTHLSWATLLLYIISRGPGAVSLDRRLGIA